MHIKIKIKKADHIYINVKVKLNFSGEDEHDENCSFC